jgi:aspartyl-tRNA synthetase
MVYITKFTNEEFATNMNDQEELKNLEVFGFCHNVRVNKKMIFIVLRHELETMQLIIFKDQVPLEYEKVKNIKFETTIKAEGVIVPAQVKTCTVTNYEMKVTKLDIINESKELVFSLDDANETFQQDSNQQDSKDDNDIVKKENDRERCKVGRQIRLDNRWLDLRIFNNQNIFRLRSHLEYCLRQQLMLQDFIEIHTPKIISAVSEGGSNVFDVNYFNKKVYLAQSPQLYKQMMINSGFSKVFEIGPIFRAENANTYRHLCEFTGLDMEFMIRPEDTHIDIITKIWKILYEAFKEFENRYEKQIEYILEKTGTDKLIFPENPVIIDFKTGVKLLEEAGIEQSALDDIGSENEKLLGDIIKKNKNTDVYVLAEFPSSCRPFYTMELDDDIRYSKSFDIMMRGNEISSGSQRIHNPENLKKSIANRNIKLDGKSGLEDYVRSFETGSMPHGGCGIGLERLIMLYLGLKNVRNTSLFPRDPQRITP